MEGEKHVFTASRWTAGNLFFPVRLELTPESVTRVKPRLIGSDEETISISKVASVAIRTGLIWADIRIDSSGGTDPILSRGHAKEDAVAVRDLIQRYQQAAPRGREAP